MSRTSEKFDELRQMMEQLINRMDRLETRRRSSRSHNRTKQAAHLCEAPKEVVKGGQVDREEEVVLLPAPKEEEGEILSKGEEPVLLLAPKEDVGEILSKGEKPVLLRVPKEEEGESQPKGNLPVEDPLVLKEFQEVSSDELLSGLTPFHESKLSSTCPVDREAVRDGQTDQFVIKLEGRQCQLSPLTSAHIQESRNSIPRSTPTTILLLLTKEVDRASPVKKIFLNIVIFCRLVRLGRRFLKDRGRKRISYNPRAWVWDHFRQGKAPFQEGENDEVIPSSKDQSLALMALSSTLDGIDIGDQ